MASNLLYTRYYNQEHPSNEINDTETNDEINSDTDTILDTINTDYIFYIENDDHEYTLNDIKNMNKESREYIIDYIVEDEYEIAESIVDFLMCELRYQEIYVSLDDNIQIQLLLKQFRRIMNI